MDHPARRIRSTNAVLPASEISSVRNRLSDAKTDLTYLSIQIMAASSAVLEQLLDRRAELTAEIEAYQITLAPHKKLPPEILAEIFRYCVPCPVYLPPKLHEAPLLLCQICSFWRSVALHTPTLWNNIEARCYISYDRLLEMVKTWFSRSGTFAPLAIDIGPYRWCRRSFLVPELVDELIIPYINRFRKISISLPTTLLQPLLRLPTGSAALLEHFQLDLTDDDICWLEDDVLRNGPVTFFNSASHLRIARFKSSLSNLQDPRIFSLPWIQLTDLHFHGIFLPPDTCYAVLRQCANLVACTLGIFSRNRNQITATPNIVLPNLREFSLCVKRDITYAPFLQPFVFTVLRMLKLSTEHASGMSSLALAFASLSARSWFNLEVFILDGVRISSADVTFILTNMPSLVELNLDWIHSLDATNLAMISRGALVPNLRVLRLHLTPPRLHAVVDMIESRWRVDADHPNTGERRCIPISQLREVTLYCAGWYRNESESNLDISRLYGFQAEGLMIDLIDL